MTVNVDDYDLQIIKKRYILIKQIGKGGYSTVWLSYDYIDSKYYAMKVGNVEDYSACKKETEIYDKIKKFNCNVLMNLVRSFDYKNDDDELQHCEVFELMGYSLYDYVKKYGPLDKEIIKYITQQILEGLTVLHNNNIIHGDIKPDNILLCKKSPEIQTLISNLSLDKIINQGTMKDKKQHTKILNSVKRILIKYKCLTNNSSSNNDSDSESASDSSYIMEFSMSSNKSSDHSTSNTDNIKSDLNNINDFKIKIADMGGCVTDTCVRKKQIQTVYYMSPEILLRLPYDETSDIWALGCSIYELLTGHILFDPDDFDGNEDRCHLYLITSMIGPIPEKMIADSRYSDIFYTQDKKKIKGFTEFKQQNINDIINIHTNNKDINLNHFIIDCLSLDPSKRMDCNIAINHSFVKHQ